MKPTYWILLITVSVLLGTLPLTATAGEPGPANLRERAEQIEQEARELKEQGRHDQAGRRQLEAEELRQQARNRDGDHPSEVGRRELNLSEGRDLERELGRLRQERREILESSGSVEHADKVEQRIGELEHRWEQLSRPEPGDRSARPRQEVGPRDPQPEAIREKMEHARMAIHHLHSAGFPDLAEQLERQVAERVRQLRQRRASVGPRPAASPEQSEPLLRHMEEMRRALREMNRRLERLEQDLH